MLKTNFVGFGTWGCSGSEACQTTLSMDFMHELIVSNSSDISKIGHDFQKSYCRTRGVEKIEFRVDLGEFGTMRN